MLVWQVGLGWERTLPWRWGTVLGWSSLRRRQHTRGRVRAATQLLSGAAAGCCSFVSVDSTILRNTGRHHHQFKSYITHTYTPIQHNLLVSILVQVTLLFWITLAFKMRGEPKDKEQAFNVLPQHLLTTILLSQISVRYVLKLRAQHEDSPAYQPFAFSHGAVKGLGGQCW